GSAPTHGRGARTPSTRLPRSKSTSVFRVESEVPGGGQLRDVRTADGLRSYARGRLIESRLSPNAISLSALIPNLAAAVLVIERLFFLAGVAFIVGSVMDTLDG